MSFALFFLLLLLACTAVATINAGALASMVAMEQRQLSDGNNLLYAGFGDTSALAAGVDELMRNLQLSVNDDDNNNKATKLLCIDVASTAARETMKRIHTAQQQQLDSSVLTVLFENVEKLHAAEQLLHLDFLFRLPDKSYDMSGVVGVLLFNTDFMPAATDGTAGSPGGVFWDASASGGIDGSGSESTRQQAWREGVRRLWHEADEVVQFNVDAAIGRINRGLFFPASSNSGTGPDADTGTAITQSTGAGAESVCVALSLVAKDSCKGEGAPILPLLHLPDSSPVGIARAFKKWLLSIKILQVAQVLLVANVVFFTTMLKRAVEA